MIRSLIQEWQHRSACKRLDTLVAQTNAANAGYAARRAAGKLGHARKRVRL